MWYVYFLKLSNGDIYVGSTNDLVFLTHARVREGRSTKWRKGDWMLVMS